MSENPAWAHSLAAPVQSRHLGGGWGAVAPKKNEKMKKTEKRERKEKKRETRKKGTMNSVKLLHIKCCFFQFFNNTVALKNIKKCWHDAPALVPKFMLVSDEGSDQSWDNDWASWSSVLPQTRASAMKYMSMKNIEYALNTFFVLYDFFLYLQIYILQSCLVENC